MRYASQLTRDVTVGDAAFNAVVPELGPLVMQEQQRRHAQDLIAAVD